MSDDPHIAAQLADLVADTRALLDDARARGVWAEPPPDPAALEPVAAEPAAAEPAADDDEATPPSGGSAWSAMARDAREAPLTGRAALERVRAELGDCRRCALSKGRRNLVFGVGDPEADLVVVGEAPGYHEDQQGEPFVGPAGQMLDRMLENVLGLRRDQVYILNVVKCRPPKNRNPQPDEVDACRPFLEGQLRAIAPKVGLVLGSVAFRTLFRTPEGIMRNRGRWRELGDVPMMPTFHPAYLLRKPQDKRLTFDDLKELRRRYDEVSGRR